MLQQLALVSRRVVAARVRNRNVTAIAKYALRLRNAQTQIKEARACGIGYGGLAQSRPNTFRTVWQCSAVHTAVTADLAVQLGLRCFLRCEAGLSGHSRCEAAVARTSCGR